VQRIMLCILLELNSSIALVLELGSKRCSHVLTIWTVYLCLCCSFASCV